MNVDIDLCHMDGNSAHDLFNATAATTIGPSVIANNRVYGVYAF